MLPTLLYKYTLSVKTFSVAKLAGKILMSVCLAVRDQNPSALYLLVIICTNLSGCATLKPLWLVCYKL